MLPSLSTAGLATGCRFSAIGTATRSSRGLLLRPFVATTTSPEAAPWGTRATMNCSELIIIEPSISPKWTRGRRSSGGRRPLPVIRISPPGRAHPGSMASMCGLPFTFFVPALRSIISILAPKIIHHGDHGTRSFGFHKVFSVISVPPWLIFIPMSEPQAHVTLNTSRDRLPQAPKAQQQLQNNQCVNSSPKIVHYDTRSFGQPFEAANRGRLHDVEYPEKYKAREQRLPHDGTRYQGDQLPSDFVNHDMRRIFLSTSSRFQRRRWNSDGHNYHDQQPEHRNSRTGREM